MRNYFTVEELCKSDTAIRHNICNTPGTNELGNIKNLISNVLNPARIALGEPIHVTSGFRCEKLNQMLGGAERSSHLYGEAADIELGNKTKEENQALFEFIKNNLEYDQLINEFDFSWIHVSFCKGDNRQQTLEAYKEGGKTKYKHVD